MKSSHTILRELLHSAGVALFCLGFVTSVLSLLAGFWPGLSMVLLMLLGYGLVALVTTDVSLYTLLPFIRIRDWHRNQSPDTATYMAAIKFILKAAFGATIAIILVLACILWLGQGYFHHRNTNQECAEITSALIFYKESTNRYPSDLRSVIGNDPLRRSWDKDDWGNFYLYTLENNRQSFKLVSAGPDGQSGTSDDLLFQNP